MDNRKVKLEYIYLDGYTAPIYTGGDKEAENANVRSKTKIIRYDDIVWDELDGIPNPDDLPLWSSDGSSSKQAEGNFSDIVLKPVYVCKDPTRSGYAFLVLCEVLNSDMSVHKSNTRNKFAELYERHKSYEARFGFEQEYVLWDYTMDNVLGWPAGKRSKPDPQGKYYCGVGSWNVAGREFVEYHMELCIKAGLDITGINAEVMLGQWEYQIGGPKTDGLEVCDQLWISRWLLHRASEKFGYVVDFEPKPKDGDWNGSGMHVNFSTKEMREEGGMNYINSAIENLREKHTEHIESYGTGNDARLTGKHETASIDRFSAGVSDRGASIRIPQGVDEKKRGYLEDRRPASNADPYKIGYMLMNTICGHVVSSPPGVL